MGVEKDIFWSEIGSGFGEPSGTPYQQGLSYVGLILACSKKTLHEANRVRSLLNMRGVLLGYSLEPGSNSRAQGTVSSVMTIG